MYLRPRTRQWAQYQQTNEHLMVGGDDLEVFRSVRLFCIFAEQMKGATSRTKERDSIEQWEIGKDGQLLAGVYGTPRGSEFVVYLSLVCDYFILRRRGGIMIPIDLIKICMEFHHIFF